MRFRAAFDVVWGSGAGARDEAAARMCALIRLNADTWISVGSCAWAVNLRVWVELMGVGG